MVEQRTAHLNTLKNNLEDKQDEILKQQEALLIQNKTLENQKEEIEQNAKALKEASELKTKFFININMYS